MLEPAQRAGEGEGGAFAQRDPVRGPEVACDSGPGEGVGGTVSGFPFQETDDTAGGDETTDGGSRPGGEGARVPAELNESLARLEMNTLEVKLYLDSIDQRISRMEPRLEEMRPAGVQAADAGGSEAGASQDEAADEEEFPLPTPGPSTTERRRRAQGVPVERRRAPIAAAPESAAARWPWELRGRPGRGLKRVQALLLAVGLAAVVGVAVWGTHGGARLKDGRATDGAAAGVSGIGEGPGGSQLPSGGTTGQGKAVIEQGVAAPVDRGLGVSGAGTALSGLAGTGGPGPALGLVHGVGSSATVNADAAAGGGASEVFPGGTAPGGQAAIGGSEMGAASDSGPAGSGSAGGGSTGVEVPPAAVPASPRGGKAGRAGSTPARRVNVSSGVMAGNLIYSTPAVYPKGFAGMFHTQGSVVLQAIISKSGRVQDLRVISGHFMLRGAAKDAVKTWRYRPYYVKGSAVEVATIVSVDFRR